MLAALGVNIWLLIMSICAADIHTQDWCFLLSGLGWHKDRCEWKHYLCQLMV